METIDKKELIFSRLRQLRAAKVNIDDYNSSSFFEAKYNSFVNFCGTIILDDINKNDAKEAHGILGFIRESINRHKEVLKEIIVSSNPVTDSEIIKTERYKLYHFRNLPEKILMIVYRSINDKEKYSKIFSDESNKTTSEPIRKLKWEGTPSQFGFIIDMLIQGGYLKRPTSSYKKDAEYYSKIFDIDTTKGTLEKELSEKTNSIITKNRKKIIIPPKDELIG